MATASPIPQSWQVPQIFRDRMGVTIGRQRTMHAEGHLLIVLHNVPDPDDPERRPGKLYWRHPSGTWACNEGGGQSVGTIRAHIDGFHTAITQLDALGDEADEADEWFALVFRAAPLLRSARNMHRALQDARDAVGATELIVLRDQAGDIERALELIHDHAREGLEYSSAKSAEQQARSSQHVMEAGHRLNLIAAIFLPVTAAGSLLGMNLEHGIEKWNAPWPFWIAAASCFALGWAVRASLPKPPPPPSGQVRRGPVKA